MSRREDGGKSVTIMSINHGDGKQVGAGEAGDWSSQDEATEANRQLTMLPARLARSRSLSSFEPHAFGEDFPFVCASGGKPLGAPRGGVAGEGCGPGDGDARFTHTGGRLHTQIPAHFVQYTVRRVQGNVHNAPRRRWATLVRVRQLLHRRAFRADGGHAKST